MVLSAGVLFLSIGVVVLLAGVSVMSVGKVLSVGDAALSVGVSLLLFADVGVLLLVGVGSGVIINRDRLYAHNSLSHLVTHFHTS